ncbi:MAG: DUF362 domain-containing protein, partial [Bryobacteraceae bacterium]
LALRRAHRSGIAGMAAGMGLGVVDAATRQAEACPTVWPAPDYGTVAASVRELFRFLGLDAANPLGRWIRPGMTVVVKPNWVKHEFGPTVGRNVLFTHASRRQSGLAEMEKDYGVGQASACRLPVTFLDLRRQWAEIDDASSYVRGVYPLAGDPQGYSMVDLGARSRLVCFGVNARFGVTDYNAKQSQSPHCYPVGNTVLSADVILNVPKLKTHMKTGMTAALKNFVGITVAKDFLPHFRAGSPSAGGDEYPDRNWLSHAASPVRKLLQTRAPLWLWKLARAGAQTASSPLIHGGGWHGNDTLWRTIHDLVDIARNYDVGGAPRPQPRTILTLVDAIVAGEDCGPLKPRPKPCGLLVWGEDPGMVDVTCATLMGFDWRRIPLLSHLCDVEARAFTDFRGETPTVVTSTGPFAAPVGWAGEIEAARRE